MKKVRFFSLFLDFFYSMRYLLIESSKNQLKNLLFNKFFHIFAIKDEFFKLNVYLYIYIKV